MLQILVITLREGIEAFLIVAITAGILRQTGRAALLPALYWGTGVAIALSLVVSKLLARTGLSSMWEGVLAAAAMVMVISMTVYMWKSAHTMPTTIKARIQEATLNRPTRAAWWSLFGFVLLMIVREGMETALMLSYLYRREGGPSLFIGGVLGVLCAVILAWAWTRYGQRINLARFFQVTALFLMLFSLQLAIYTLHEFFEAGAVPFLNNAFWHTATEPYGPDGAYGRGLTGLMVLIPVIWLFIAWLKDRRLVRED